MILEDVSIEWGDSANYISFFQHSKIYNPQITWINDRVLLFIWSIFDLNKKRSSFKSGTIMFPRLIFCILYKNAHDAKIREAA